MAAPARRRFSGVAMCSAGIVAALCIAGTRPIRMPHYYCRSIREKQEGRPGGCPPDGFYVAHLTLDQAVWQDIVSYFSDPDWLERILARVRERGDTGSGGDRMTA